MSESLYPAATKALADQRKALAPKCEDAIMTACPHPGQLLLNDVVHRTQRDGLIEQVSES
jgi:hypothetical protein